ncbi:ATP-NAD/AcoX kinase [Natronococcus amylolyticus DSM 10524]|uniref:ATP-NAD/AcoX kinase n=1 Tax=Natronococcus amylolyticus DSM 10524 TaxID=1227497 RepID=L9X5M8_9EURY|nr:NAD(+)/NADH kinase [Natronococcus amylolyticus]ELY57094.1 ATP-NAD/AcoX kinase [Natronococcus amylolyticus DSM 10524]
MDAAWEPPEDGAVVGIVAEEADRRSAVVDSLAASLEDRGRTIVEVSAAVPSEADASVLVALGECALSALARETPDVPVLPVGDSAGLESVAAESVADALEAILSNTASVRSHPILEVALEGERYRGLFDVTLVTAEPAKISEYSVRSDDELVGSFRSDGVVAATPAGTHGYASAVDAPELSAALEAVAVAPIAPFATHARQWVLPPGFELRVERDEGPVTLVVDDRSVRSVPVGSPVELTFEDELRTLVPSADYRR